MQNIFFPSFLMQIMVLARTEDFKQRKIQLPTYNHRKQVILNNVQ